MPLFGKKKLQNVSVSPELHTFLENVIQYSKFANLSGQKREDKIQELANELEIDISLMNVRNLSQSQQQELLRLASIPNNMAQIEAFLTQNIPNYEQKLSAVFRQLADRYER